MLVISGESRMSLCNVRPDSELKGVQVWYDEADEDEEVQVIRIPVKMKEWADLVLMAEWM